MILTRGGCAGARLRARVAIDAGPLVAAVEGDADERAVVVDAEGFCLATGERVGPGDGEDDDVGVGGDDAGLVARAQVPTRGRGRGAVDRVRLFDGDDAGVGGDGPGRGRRAGDAQVVEQTGGLTEDDVHVHDVHQRLFVGALGGDFAPVTHGFRKLRWRSARTPLASRRRVRRARA